MISLRYSFIAAAMVLIGTQAALANQAYKTPEQAAQSLYTAVSTHDKAALKMVLGNNWHKYLPVSEINQDDVNKFLENWKTSHKIETTGKSAKIIIGSNEWVMPIPLVNSKKGWEFDIKKGAEEIRTRTIGRNELSTIKAVKAYADAQHEYAQIDRNGDGVKEFAQKIISSSGKKDGLYWQSSNQADQSPIGPNFGGANIGKDYHGYYYRILTMEGKDANGGARNYIKNGKMTEGFALIAWPASYGQSGISSFMINQDGIVFERNLGPATDRIARSMKSFNPDSLWKKSVIN